MTKCKVEAVDFARKEMTFAANGQSATYRVAADVFFKDFDGKRVKAKFVEEDGEVVCTALSLDFDGAKEVNPFARKVEVE